MLLQITLLILGFFVLVKGADWLVDGASALAKHYRVPDLAIGLTVVAFGTSAPELIVNVVASAQSHQDIVLGNILGSNIFNLFAILGISGIITPLVVQSSTVWKEITFSLFAVVILYLMANFMFGEMLLSRIEGFILLGLFILFLLYVLRQLKADEKSLDLKVKKRSFQKILLLIILGLSGLVIGGRLIVDSAVQIAQAMGLTEKIIGLTIIAAGTSLPELSTSVVAALKKNNDIAVGNIIGSNIFNIFLILAISALIKPIPYNVNFNLELYLLAGGTFMLFLAMFTGKRKKLDRWEAAVLLTAFVIYTSYLVIDAM